MFIKKYWALSLIICAGFVIHLIPLVRFGSYGLGYDTGFYRRHLIKPLASFPNTLTPGLGEDALLPRLALDILRLLRVPPDILLFGSYLLLWAVSAAILYYVVARIIGKKEGLASVLLFTFSPIQYVAYWFMLWKHAFALPIFFGLLLTLERRSYWSLLFGLALALSHNTTSAFALVSLGVYLTIQPKTWRTTGSTLALVTLVYAWLHPQVSSYTTVRPLGVFVPTEYFLWNIAPLAPFVLLGLTRITSKRTSLFAFVLSAFAFPLAGLPFWERILIFTDIALIITAACGIAASITWVKEQYSTKVLPPVVLASALLLGLYLALLNNRIRDWDPFATPLATRDAIAKASQLLPPNETIVTTTELAPWVFGWTKNKIIAPGLLGDPHNHEEWIQYWGDPNHPEAQTFLDTYGETFYFLIPPDEQNAFVPKNKCVRALSEYLLEYRCPTAGHRSPAGYIGAGSHNHSVF